MFPSSLKLRRNGFCQFVGVDGSEGMLDQARKTGLYQELKQCMLGQDALPVQNGNTFSLVKFGMVIYFSLYSKLSVAGLGCW